MASRPTPETVKLRVAVDARSLNVVHLRGMGRYLREVITRGSALDAVQWLLLSDRPDRPFHLPEVAGVRSELFSCRGYRFHAWDQLALPWHVARRSVDVLHCPSTVAPWWQPVPTVVTIHDTLPWAPEDPDRDAHTDYLLPAAYRKCAAVITISKSSQRDILQKWPELGAKLHVVPHGVDEAYLNAVPCGLSESLLAMGVRRPTCSTWVVNFPASGPNGPSRCWLHWPIHASAWCSAGSSPAPRTASGMPLGRRSARAWCSPPLFPIPTWCGCTRTQWRSCTRRFTRDSASPPLRRRPWELQPSSAPWDRWRSW